MRLYDFHKIPTTTDHALDLKGGRLLQAASGVREIAFHPTRDLLAVTVGTGVRIVTFEGNELANLLNAHGEKANVEAVAFDTTGETLATGDASGLIKLWAVDPKGGLKFLRELTGHTRAVYALAFSSDGRVLASGGDDCAVILWGSGHRPRAIGLHRARGPRVAGGVQRRWHGRS